MFLERVRKKFTLCCCNRRDSCISPLSAGHIQQRFSSLFRQHNVIMLHCCLHGLVLRNAVSFLYACRVPFGVYSSYDEQYCVSYSTQNTLFGTSVDGRMTLGDAGFSNIESLRLRRVSCFPPILFGICVKDNPTPSRHVKLTL
jgi:hypothetical protein